MTIFSIGILLGMLLLLALVLLCAAVFVLAWVGFACFALAYLVFMFIRGLGEGFYEDWQEAKAQPPSAQPPSPWDRKVDRWCAKLDSMYVRPAKRARDDGAEPSRLSPQHPDLANLPETGHRAPRTK